MFVVQFLKMTFRELKEKIASFTEDQLKQPVIVFMNDEEIGREVDFLDEQSEDIYWYEGDPMGPLGIATEWLKDNPDEGLTIGDFTKIPKGQPSLHITDSL